MTNRKFRYGELNPADHPQKGKTLDPSQYSGADWIMQSAEEIRTPRFLQKVTGPLQGVCLRVESKPGDKKAASSWFGGLFASDEDIPVRTVIRARIPELHAHLPDPDCYGPDGPNAVMLLYPAFESEKELETPPEPGELVWLDFKDREKLNHPIYIGRVNNKAYNGGIKCKPDSSPASAVNGPARGGLGNQPPAGDSIGGGTTPGGQNPTSSPRYGPDGQVGGSPPSTSLPTVFPPPRQSSLNALSTDAFPLFRQLIDAYENAGLPIRVWETLRTAERQQYLFTKGRTRQELDAAGVSFPERPNDNKVTWTLNSKHIAGNAVDFILQSRSSYWTERGINFNKDIGSAWNTSHPEALKVWQEFGKIAKELDFEWGGDWSKKDWPHVETKSSQFNSRNVS